jgi:hypothetical protein
MSWDFTIAPLLPWPLLVAILVAGLVFMVITVVTRGRGWILRSLALALLLLALVNPSLRNEDRENLSDIAVAVVDHSRSQSFGDRTQRTERALNDLKQAVARLGNTELRVVSVTSNVSAENDGTRLFSALNEALSEVPPERFAGAVFITDGQVHDVPSDLKQLGLTAPLHGLITGSRKEVDRRIVIEQSPRFGIVGKEQTVRFRVDETGNKQGPVGVTIRRNNGEEQTIDVLPGQSVSLPVLVDHGGQNITEIIADPLPGEITEQNNRAISIIEGIRDRLRVLLVSGEPHPGERTWRNLLKADASVDLVHFTILRPPEKQDGTPIKELSLIAFPTRELFVEKLDEFDLIIFDRYQRRGILPMMYLANIADYVKRGGAVLIAAGPDFAAEDGLYNTPLNAVLQVVPSGRVLEGGFKPHVTERGQRHPVTRDLPGGNTTPPHWGRWFRVIDVDKPTGEVVMQGAEDKPLLVLNRQGKGRVALLLSDHAWLWARGFEGGGPHVDLLRRLAHWLMQEPDLEEEALRASARAGELTVERQTMADTTEPVIVRSPSGVAQTVTLSAAEPGLWRASVPADEIGLYRVEQGERRAFAHVGAANPREFIDARSTPEKLAPLVRETGGRVARMADTAGTLELPRVIPVRPGGVTSGNDWIGIRMTEASMLKGVDRLPLFAGLLGLALLLGAFAATWYREGR